MEEGEQYGHGALKQVMAVGSTQKEGKAAFRKVGYSVVYRTHGDPSQPRPHTCSDSCLRKLFSNTSEAALRATPISIFSSKRVCTAVRI